MKEEAKEKKVSSTTVNAATSQRLYFDNRSKSLAKEVPKATVTTTFADVAGCDEAKSEIMEFVQFLKDPKRFSDLGAKVPRGGLLCGPPGTGKTLLAKAVAGEANLPFFSSSGSEFVEIWGGLDASRVRDLFNRARASAPCIIFIDEIDAVGGKRKSNSGDGFQNERDSTLNQLLVEMDGFNSQSHTIVVLAGTNRADTLDPALKRPGRFDSQIHIGSPDITGRKAIFDIYLKKLTLSDTIETYSSRLAALTPGFVGADIANICNEAAITAARRNKKQIDMDDFATATDRVIAGSTSRKVISPHERKVIAYHEAGHAVVGWFLKHTDSLLKVTIVPRSSGFLGFAQFLPKESFLQTQEQILEMIYMLLAGRASEQIHFGEVTTGAADDLKKVTEMVKEMVMTYGMNSNVGQMVFEQSKGSVYSGNAAKLIEDETRMIIDQAYEKALELIKERQEQVKLVAELLLEKETITHEDIAAVIGARPHSVGKEYDKFVSVGWKMDLPQPKPEPEQTSSTTSEETVTEQKAEEKVTEKTNPAEKPNKQELKETRWNYKKCDRIAAKWILKLKEGCVCSFLVVFVIQTCVNIGKTYISY
jgi:AFG3 family protein